MAYQKHDWTALFTAFEESNQSQAEFCKAHNLSLGYFSAKLRQRVLSEQNSSPFSQVAVQPSIVTGITLEVGQCKIHCPASLPIESLVMLVRALR